MRKLFIYSTAIFLIISTIGITVATVNICKVYTDLDEIINKNISLFARYHIFEDIHALFIKAEKEPDNTKDQMPLAERISNSLDSCNKCHHSGISNQVITRMIILNGFIKDSIQANNIDIKQLRELEKLSKYVAEKGEKLVKDKNEQALTDIRVGGIIFVLTIVLSIVTFVSVTIFILKRLNKNISDIIKSTELISSGKNIELERFGMEFKKVGVALQTMYNDLKIKTESLEEWTKRWKETYDAINDMIAVSDSNGVLVLANRAFHNLFGSEKESHGKGINDLVCKEGSDTTDCPVRSTILDGKPHSQLFEYKNLFISVKTFPLNDEDGSVYGAIWVGRDITKERELEQRARQSEKLIALGEMVSGVAHEINNPLTAIMGTSAMLLEEESDEHREKIDVIYQSSKRIAGITKNLLDFSTMKTLDMMPININKALEEIIELKKYQLETDNIEVKTQLMEDMPLIVLNREQMLQVLLNIINNSHQAILDSGNPGAIFIKTSLDGNKLLLQIEDNGPGIPENIKSRIFEPFFTTREVGKGTGLGLSVTHSIIKAHKGEIWVESDEGKGSKFLIELPINK